MKKFAIYLTITMLFIIGVFLVAFPERYLPVCKSALCLWAMTVVPALLPFFFISLVICKIGEPQKIAKIFSPVTNFLYRGNGISAFVQIMSFISGYPVGAKLISELYCEGAIDSREATKMSTYCSTSGPLFIAGSVGVSMLGDKKIGFILLLSHVLSAVFNGILFRFYGDNRPIDHFITKNNSGNVLYDCCYEATLSCLLVGTFIAVFFVIAQILTDIKLMYLPCLILTKITGDGICAQGLCTGIIECTNGCLIISKSTSRLRLPLISATVAFGGLSVIFQSLIFLKKAHARTKIFILSKITQMAFAFVICLAICRITSIY